MTLHAGKLEFTDERLITKSPPRAGISSCHRDIICKVFHHVRFRMHAPARGPHPKGLRPQRSPRFSHDLTRPLHIRDFCLCQIKTSSAKKNVHATERPQKRSTVFGTLAAGIFTSKTSKPTYNGNGVMSFGFHLGKRTHPFTAG